jgi:hypothetical protein
MELPEYVRKHVLALHLAWDVCARNLRAAEKQRKEAHDKKYQTNVTFSVGDRVLLLQPGRQDKMAMPFIGPYRVVAGPDVRDRYQLRDLEGRRFNYFHVSKLKLWPDTDDLEDDYYVIEKVVDSRMHQDGQRRYRIRWRGWGKRYDTWESLDNLNEAAAAEARRFDQLQTAAEPPAAEEVRDAAPPRPRIAPALKQLRRAPSPHDTDTATSRTTQAATREAQARAKAVQQQVSRDQRVAARGHRFN